MIGEIVQMHRAMRFITGLLLLVVTPLAVVLPATAKGPKDIAASNKYQNKGGYSASVPSSSKYAQPSSKDSQRSPVKKSYSRIPTQTPYQKKVLPSPEQARPPIPSASQAMASKYSRYSKGRPSSDLSSSLRYPSSASRPSTAVRFPSRPTPSRPGSPSTTSSFDSKQKNIPAQRPPVIFYPQKGGPSSTATKPSVGSRPTVAQPDYRPEPNVFKSKYFQPSLRPQVNTSIQSQGPIILNRPTTINQATTNVVNNTNNINNWYTNNSWQNHVTVNSQNWNDRPWWHQPEYSDWHHGNWNSHYIPGGLARNDWEHVDTSEHSWLTGLAAWGLGNMIYRTGYRTYSNPYFDQPVRIGSTTINYSLPITVQHSSYEQAYANDQLRAKQLRLQALQLFEGARQAFYVGDLDSAYKNIDRSIGLMPDDTSMHEFRSLVLFAFGQYRQSAEAIHAVLAVAPGWDWTTMSGLYAESDTYVRQLRDLEDYVRANPRESDVRFLLAYHYITQGHMAEAASQLQAVRTLSPEDRLSRDLLDLISRKGSEENRGSLSSRPPTQQEFQGRWTARRSDGKIELDVRGAEFTWDFDLKENNHKFRGKFELSQDLVVFASRDGSQMVGHVAMVAPDQFVFHLIGRDNDDEGVLFKRR